MSMTTRRSLLQVLTALGFTSLAILIYLCMQDPTPPDGTTDTPPAVVPDVKKAATNLTGADARASRTPERPRRELDRVAADHSGAGHAQGVRGVVLDADGYPLAGATVYLMPGLKRDVFGVMARQQKGQRFPPVAWAATGKDGGFALGIDKLTEDNAFDVRILHERHCDHDIAGIQLQENDWFDTKQTRLKRGVQVHGRVRIQGTSMPLKGATVFLQRAGTAQLFPTPGREQGLTATTDAAGRYRLPHVDPSQPCALSALAPGFARQQREQVKLAEHGATRVDFELVAGHAIAGMVTGPTGRPLVYSKVTAAGISEKNTQVETVRTDEEGRFHLPGLRTGSYSITAEAPGFITATDQPVAAGKDDVHIVLEKQGAVILQVFGKGGKPLPNYEAWVRGYFSGQSVFGRAVAYQHVRNSRNGRTTLGGIDPMEYVIEVRASAHAKSFSAPFKILEGQSTPRVTVRLGEGGVIEGVVTNRNGVGLANVAIATFQSDYVYTRFEQYFGRPPARITETRVVTGSDGRFRIPLLNTGKYQLRYTHKDYCNLISKGHDVVVGQTTSLGTIKMIQGALVEGTARLRGIAKGQIQVEVSRVAQEGAAPLSCEAVTDNRGHFRLPQRLPPGDYEARSHDKTNPDFFAKILSAKSVTRFRIGAGQTRYRLNLVVPTAGK